MTDEELIELLRNSPFTFNDIVADRIEQLEKDIEIADDAINHWMVAYNNMEAKLAKAVDVIKHIINIAPEGDDDEWHIALDDASTMLAELEKPE